MNTSFFIAIEKIKVALKAFKKTLKTLKEILRPRLGQKLGWKERYLQMLSWSGVFMILGMPVAKLCIFLTDIEGTLPIVQVFWSLIGLGVATATIISNLFLLISVPIILIWSIIIFIRSSKNNSKNN